MLDEPGADEVAAAAAPDLAGARRRPTSTRCADWATRAPRRRPGRKRARAARARWSPSSTRAVAAWRPLRDDLELVTRLSAFVEGKSADNRLQMRLSAYVLAYRLSQVVAAANERLGRMSDQRYSLEHTGRRGAGETRGGLSLLVRDDWSGEARDPATLSGGETFVVSLALALGLADVVTHEAGGADLDTLFVDEGFGALDADTLDDVMDTLDSLRDGGRVVGVVSHVAEMRDRIPTQLLVSKSRRGSTPCAVSSADATRTGSTPGLGCRGDLRRPGRRVRPVHGPVLGAAGRRVRRLRRRRARAVRPRRRVRSRRTDHRARPPGRRRPRSPRSTRHRRSSPR